MRCIVGLLRSPTGNQPKELNHARPVNRMRPVHPGEVLREEFLAPLGLSVHALAGALMVPATRIREIVKERRAVTADTAERLARHFGGEAASRPGRPQTESLGLYRRATPEL